MNRIDEKKGSGVLYLVGTPIGNLGDMTYRAVETLKAVDFICAEDTRVTQKLLTHFEIKKPLVSCHEHNAVQASEYIISRILSGENAAVVTDAGMPCISDPGEHLVKQCAQHGIEVKVVPGATAAMSAIAISGLSTKTFLFCGFLPQDKKERRSQLAAVKDQSSTLIFYEAPHRLTNTLEEMLNFFGDRKISVCRELTKIHEEVRRTTLSEALKYYSDNTVRGEFVLVVSGAENSETPETLEAALEQVVKLADNGMRPADACREIAKVSSFSKSELYTAYLERKNNDQNIPDD